MKTDFFDRFSDDECTVSDCRVCGRACDWPDEICERCASEREDQAEARREMMREMEL